MNYPSLPGQAYAPEKMLLPVAIDYPAALALRQMAIVQDELPKYLLAPEVSALLHYVPDLHRKMMVATLKIPLERRNKRTGRTEKARIWEITDRTVRTWLNEAVESAAADGVTFSVPVTPHTFRHSYAMHMLYNGIPLKVLQSLMGHKSVSSTEVYTKVFALDVAARHRVQFQMPETDAVAMLKGRG
ncbi:tyrosine-type recombinase/integrase [Salmonella enterica]|nr:tyrosine-type recombinase/integrase [Salmonella enterica]EKN2782188.1 tyrosine-type recombinase/integrase [Salmonella enterica]